MSNYLTSITKKSFWLPPPRHVLRQEVTRRDDEPPLMEATPQVISHIDEWPVKSGRVGQDSEASSSRQERRASRPFNAVDDSALIPFDAPSKEIKIPEPMKGISNYLATDAIGRPIRGRTAEDKKALAIFPRSRIKLTREVVDPQNLFMTRQGISLPGKLITPATWGEELEPVHPHSSELWDYRIPAHLRVSPDNPRYPEPHEGDRGLPPNFPRFPNPDGSEHIRALDYYNYLWQRIVHDKAQQRGQQETLLREMDGDAEFARQQVIDFGQDDPWDDSWMRTPSYLALIQEQDGREAAQSLHDEMTSQEKDAYNQALRERAATGKDFLVGSPFFPDKEDPQ